MVIVGVAISTRLRECSTSPVMAFEYLASLSRTPPPTQLSNIVIVRITLYSLTSRRIHEALGCGGWPALDRPPSRRYGYFAGAAMRLAQKNHMVAWRALQRGTSTNRPETCPLLSWCRASLTCASGRVAVWHRTFPAAPMASTAMRSSRVPTEEAWMRTSSAAIWIAGKHRDSEGKPTTRSIPVGLTQGKAASYAAFAAEVTSAACTPPARLSSLTTFTELAFNVADTPKLLACASFSSETSMAVTIAPSPRPICTAR